MLCGWREYPLILNFTGLEFVDGKFSFFYSIITKAKVEDQIWSGLNTYVRAIL